MIRRLFIISFCLGVGFGVLGLWQMHATLATQMPRAMSAVVDIGQTNSVTVAGVSASLAQGEQPATLLPELNMALARQQEVRHALQQTLTFGWLVPSLRLRAGKLTALCQNQETKIAGLVAAVRDLTALPQAQWSDHVTVLRAQAAAYQQTQKEIGDLAVAME